MAPYALIPLRQSAQCDMETQRGCCQTFADAHLQVKGDSLEFVVVSLHLSSQVTGDGRETPVALFVVVVQSEVNANGHGVVACDMRGDEFRRDTTAESVGKGIGKRSSHCDVTGREGAQVFVIAGGLLHRAVVHVLGSHAPCGTIACTFHESSAGRLGTLHIGHEVQVDGFVAHTVD